MSKKGTSIAPAKAREKEQDAVELRKAVEAIAIKPHAGRLTLLTRKLNNVLLAAAQEQGIDRPIYRLALSQVCAKTDFDSSNTAILKDHLRKMASATVEWNLGAKGSRRWGITNMLEVEIIEDGQRCWIEWGYPAKLKDKLLAPDVYARLNLQWQNSFRSGAALALYEICVRYADSPGQLTMRLPWEEWRPRLTGVPDSEDSTYKEYKYFKRDVIKPAMVEVNSLTAIEVSLIEHKNGRAVADLQFSVKQKNQAALSFDEPNLIDLSLISRMQSLGFSQAQAEKVYTDTDEGRLRGTLDYVEKRLKQANPPIENPVAYFRDALAKGYGVKAPGQLEGEKQKALAKPKGKGGAPGPESPAEVTRQLAEAWWSEQRQMARDSFFALSAAEQGAELARFEATGVPSHLTKRWKNEGLENPMCLSAFTKWRLSGTPQPTEVELLQFGLARGLISAKLG